MTFFTLHYIEAHQNENQLLLMALMFIALATLIFFTILYLRDRFATKYRDLGIIALLFLFLLSGAQYQKYLKVNSQKSQTVQIIPFIKSVAQDEGVPPSDVWVNSEILKDGLIVRINSKDIDYQLNLNSDNNTYTLTQAHVIDHRVEVKN
ncbi:hypothetical protein FC52_GL001394 [Lactobacillus pasteurii DSM 23907 = CRBIP 24.76]|uniref:DUF3290 domain-containing protein n=1 Tax=Lactobacillus pasteurii DSM 23907 = CRBIP 24.76 TaxID=1423790 RepID=I7IY46_9LACO|nr:DUF3290 domain-containing protein [Lactobacillus pasteurii]KRK07955.1 hypothetical protein FC52_GL001394 [Lactobacillus pasteurii DSM 23907 = CRBIP 24.76]TDG77880.1 hypothetical protein C5L33_001685 [Lactobacillus pasteurii]CCI84277.1 Putative uncharacterized protein [Lactobacillus pasteurii DSM 23907 = CRBIP 24.76]